MSLSKKHGVTGRAKVRARIRRLRVKRRKWLLAYRPRKGKAKKAEVKAAIATRHAQREKDYDHLLLRM